MRWASALSEEKDPIAAIEECASKIRAEGSSPDAAFLFISRDHCPDAALLPAALARALSPKHIPGCSAGGVIGGGREVERERAGSHLRLVARRPPAPLPREDGIHA